MENAQNLLRAGRQRPKDITTTKFEKDNNLKESFNRYINSKVPQNDSFFHFADPVRIKGSRSPEELLRMDESRKALRGLYESRTNPLLRDGKVTKLRKLAKAKKVGKIAGIGAGIAGTAALGTVAYKKNKDKKKEENN